VKTMMPYRQLENEFNARQLSGEACEDLVRHMIAVLSQPPRIIRFGVGSEDEAA
jgi:hypothetical protein